MSQHRRRRIAAPPVVEDEPVRRFGFLSMETALVLGLVVLIVVGSLLVQVTFPSNPKSETVIGDKKVKITTVGKGGVMPGPVQPRALPVIVPTPVPTETAKPRKPRKPKPIAGTVTPTPTSTPTKGSGGVPILTPAGGGDGAGAGACTVPILCKPGQKPAGPPEPDPAATQPPGPQQATQSLAQ